MLANKSSMLPSQLNFRSLSLPDLQHVGCDQEIAFLSIAGRSSSNKSALPGLGVRVPASDPISKSTARQTDALEGDSMDLDAPVSKITSELDVVYEPERILPSMAPPRRFYRTFWRSVSVRLLRRWSDTARPSGSPRAVSICYMA